VAKEEDQEKDHAIAVQLSTVPGFTTGAAIISCIVLIW
jgi:hypothetical protein